MAWLHSEATYTAHLWNLDSDVHALWHSGISRNSQRFRASLLAGKVLSDGRYICLEMTVPLRPPLLGSPNPSLPLLPSPQPKGRKSKWCVSIPIWSSLAPACPRVFSALHREDRFLPDPKTLNCHLLMSLIPATPGCTCWAWHLPFLHLHGSRYWGCPWGNSWGVVFLHSGGSALGWGRREGGGGSEDLQHRDGRLSLQ